jgi:hypothetical protein
MWYLRPFVTTQVDRLKVDRLKEKTPAYAAGLPTAPAGQAGARSHKAKIVWIRLPAPRLRQAGWQVMVSWMIIIALQSSAFSLNT